MNAIASDAVASARAMLNNAIRACRDTFTARKELTAAEQAAARERAANDNLLGQMQKARADAISRQVRGETKELTDAIKAECQSVLPGFAPDVTVESHRLTLLLEAKSRLADIQAARNELQHDLENLRTRLGEVETQIAAIHAGDDRSDAAMGRVHMLGLDRSDIAALIEAAAAQMEALELPALGDLERGWLAAKTEARFRARAAVMGELERRLLDLATEARAILGPGQHPELRYRPNAVMRQAAQQAIV